VSYLEIIQVLLSSGALISAQDRGLAVIEAAREGFVDIVKELLANGALSANHRGQAICHADGLQYEQIVKILVENGTIADEHRNRAHAIATENGYLDLAQLLKPA